jgi:DNA-binding response OmpR family regulator
MAHPEADIPGPYSLRVRQRIILVADDEVMIHDIITILLQEHGYVVLSAFDGQEALEASRRYPGTIDLVITDVDMPRLNGIELCMRLLEERPGIKVIVMSGKDKGEIVRQSINTPFLSKPFKGETLLASVREMLEPPKQNLIELL